MYLNETGNESVERTHLVQDRDKYGTAVNTAMNLRFSKDAGNCLVVKKLSASQEEICSMKLLTYLVG